MNPFRKYLSSLSKSPVINTKLLLLTYGLDVNFSSIKKNFSNIDKKYKVNQVRVSDRHFISPQSEQRNFLPDELILRDNYIKSLVKVYYKKNSPLLLKTTNKKFNIYYKNLKLPLQIEPIKQFNYSKLDYQGYKLSEFVSILGKDRIAILPFEGCEHWVGGERCKFCGANPARLKFRSYKHNVYDIKTKSGGNHSKWWKEREEFTLKAIEKGISKLKTLDVLSPHTHLFILSGGLLNVDYLWKICLKIAKIVNKHIPIKDIDSYINLIPPKNFNLLKEVKKIGFRYICYNLEVFGEERFKSTCPGKDSVYGYKNFLKAFDYTASLFGTGKVRCNFVLGAQPISELRKGVKYLAKRGIVSDYSVFFPRPGSIWRNRQPPSPEKILNFTRELVTIYKKYNFNPFCCSLSSRSSIANEVFIIESK